jgi:predicted phosphodiesterase
MTTQRVAVISDLHIPYHHPGAVDLLIAVIQAWRPERIIYNGDLLDFYSVSSHDKNPDRLRNGGLQTEIDTWVNFAQRVAQAAPSGCLYDFVPGNHEDRLRRWMWKNEGLHGLRALELPTLLGLPELGITYNAHEVLLAGGSLAVKHGHFVRKFSGQSAKAELEGEHYALSTITGHTHRLGNIYVRVRDQIVGAWENGCLCELHPEYVRNPDWHLGITQAWVEVEGNGFTARSLPFLTSPAGAMKAFVDGVEVRA